MNTTTARRGGLYQREEKIFPHEVRGPFARLRRIAMFVLLGLYYGVVWLRVDGRQAVLFDLPARQFHVFGLTLWPQDFIYLALLLLILALVLFFSTAIAGRLWCGYACPQTVWTEAYMAIERLVDGSRNQQMRLAKAPWSANKLMRRSLKHGLWALLSLWTGFTFVGYFTPITELAVDLWQLQAHPWAVFWLLFYALATHGNAGFLREQVCKYMCPYARFQSAMFDRDTLIIAYDPVRGEPRGRAARHRIETDDARGDCIDCRLCVQVCPTGIDIREGLQYECIACAACIDACDEVMDKVGSPRKLIRYTSQNAVESGSARVLRPRILVYATILLVIITGTLWSLANRTPLRMEVLRDRNALFRELANDQIENVYSLRVVNMTDEAQTYALTLNAATDIHTDANTLAVGAGQAAAFPVRLRAPREAGVGSVPVTITLTDTDAPGVRIERDSRFFFPLPTGGQP